VSFLLFGHINSSPPISLMIVIIDFCVAFPDADFAV